LRVKVRYQLMRATGIRLNNVKTYSFLLRYSTVLGFFSSSRFVKLSKVKKAITKETENINFKRT